MRSGVPVSEEMREGWVWTEYVLGEMRNVRVWSMLILLRCLLVQFLREGSAECNSSPGAEGAGC